MSIRQLTSVGTDGLVQEVISYLEFRLAEAQGKNPKADYTEQERKIKILKAYRMDHLEILEENRIMDKKYLKIANKYDLVFKMHHDLAQENKRLSEENNNLKESIL